MPRPRTRRALWWSAALLVGAVAGLATAYLVATRTEAGRKWLATALLTRANVVFGGRGSIEVGRLRDIGPGHVVAADVVLRDTAGVAVVTVRQLRGTLSVRDLVDRAIHLRTLELDGVHIMLRQEAAGRPWNLAYLIAGDSTVARGTTPGFGDDVRIDQLRLRDVTVATRAPWAPHPMFTGVARDSVIAVRDSLHDLERDAAGIWFERRRIQLARAVAHDVIMVDVQRRPASLALDSLVGSLSDPPVQIRQARGRVAWTSDSLQLDLADVQLPNSHGRARGVVAWNQPGPVHFDVLIDADAALADLGWIWDVMPREGRGRATVRMRTLADAYDAEYALRDMRVESGRSLIEGQVAVIVRPADIGLAGVQLQFAPLDVALARRLSYEAIPKSVSGTFSGQLVAQAGGPLTAFAIDRLDLTHDAEQGGRNAPSHVRVSGMIGMGTLPRVWNVQASELRVGWDALRAWAPALSRDMVWPDGALDGRVALRSADPTDVDIAAMDLGWTDAVGHRSRLRGDLRARFDRTPLSVRSNLALDPLSMAALARLDSTIPLRRDLQGTVQVDGTSHALTWQATLQPRMAEPADGGRLVAGGTAAIDGTAWRVTADGKLTDVNLRAWVGAPGTPSTALSGPLALSVERTVRHAGGGDTLSGSGIRAQAAWRLEQTAAMDRPAFSTVGEGRLLDERVELDSLRMHTVGAVLSASGAIARSGSGVDTVQVSLRVDSLSAIRPELARVARMLMQTDSTMAETLGALAADSLRGDASLSGYLFGSLTAPRATAAFGARNLRIGARRIGGVLGSLQWARLDTMMTFSGAASADAVSGLGVVALQSASVRVSDATPASGRVDVTIRTDADAALIAGGQYRMAAGQREVTADSVRLTYNGSVWRTSDTLRIAEDSLGFRVSAFDVRSNAGGMVRGSGSVPRRGGVLGNLELRRFPIGEFSALLAGTSPMPGLLSGRADLTGTRTAPEWQWAFVADSLGSATVQLPQLAINGDYRMRRASVRVDVRDTVGGRLHADVELPIDLSFDATGSRLLDEAVRGTLRIDSLRLEALPMQVDGVSRLRGRIDGQLVVSGTVDAPKAQGTLAIDGAGAFIDALGIEPSRGTLALRADADSLTIISLGLRSGGPGDTVGVRGVVRYPSGPPAQHKGATIDVAVTARDFVASRQRDGTDLDLSGAIRVRGALERPVVSGTVFVPAANVVIDPLGARNALDLSSDAARALLGADEVPVASTAAESLAELGRFITVENARVDLGNAVWVQTPESKVKLGGGLDVEMSGDRLALDGEILATRGQYRLDLGVVNRSFAIDSGRVRFFGSAAIPPTFDISATNVVRIAGGSEIPVRVHIGGNYDRPVLSLSSRDPLYSSAPESEIISLLLFGAPTFALDGQSQSTVRAVTGVLLPSVGGAVEGALQRLLPVFNTVQVTTAGGQTAGQLSALSLLDNLSISAGKQVGDRTFLRLNTGVCRTASAAATRGASLWYGAAAEYRLGPLWSAQIGVDPGASPCTRLGPDVLPRMQFGFDLFREWIW